METCEQIITYWICPAAPARNQLASIIGGLARRLDAPVFEPHVTIYSADAANEKEGEEDCQQSFGERLHGTDAHVSDGANDLGDHR